MVAAQAPRLASKVALELALPAPAGGTIVLLGPDTEDDEVRKIASGIPEWAAGITLPASRAILIRLDRIGGYGQRELLSVLAHELTHLIVAEGLPSHGRELPAWLAEGIASSVAHEGEWRDLFVVWTSSVVSSKYPFAELDAALARGKSSKSLAYAGSLAAVGFLKNAYGPDVISRLLTGLRKGLSFDAAFREASGVPLEVAERAWARDLNLPWIWVVRIGSSYTVWMVATLLILIAYAVKRVRSRRVMESWGEEEKDDDEVVH